MSRRSGLLFAAMCVIWGLPYLLIRIAIRDLDPVAVVFFRTVIGALLLLPFALSRRAFSGVLAHWRWLAAYTVAEVTIPWLLLTRAEEHLSSSLAGLLVAVTPLTGLLVSRATGGSETIDARRLTGLGVGLAGVAALLGLQLGHIDLVAVGEIGIVALGYSVGPVIAARRLGGVPTLAVVTISLGATAVIYSPLALTHLPTHVSGEVIASMAVLAVVCTSLAFVVFLALIADIGPSRAVVVTYVNPAVALVLGVTVLSEPLTTGILVGFPVVLIGSILATTPSRRPPPTAARDEAPLPEPAEVTPT